MQEGGVTMYDKLEEIKFKSYEFLKNRYNREVDKLGVNSTNDGFLKCLNNGGTLETMWGTIKI